MRLSVKEGRQYGEPGCVSARRRRPVAGGELVGVKHPLPPGQVEQLAAPGRRKQTASRSSQMQPGPAPAGVVMAGDAGAPPSGVCRSRCVIGLPRRPSAGAALEPSRKASAPSRPPTSPPGGPSNGTALALIMRSLADRAYLFLPFGSASRRAGRDRGPGEGGGDEPNGRTRPSVRCGKQLSYGGVGSYVSILARPCLSSSSGEGRGSSSRTAPVKTVNRDDLVSGTRLPVRSRPPRS